MLCLSISPRSPKVVVDADGIASIGITDFAQDQLGDIVWVDAPDVGDEIDLDDEFAVVESVKAASDLVTPVSGVITEVQLFSFSMMPRLMPYVHLSTMPFRLPRGDLFL